MILKSFRSFSLTLVCFSLACTTQNQRLEQALQKEDCESAFAELANHGEGIKTPTSPSDMAASALAYTYVGTSYTVQFLWSVTGGIITFVGLCGPALVVSSLTNTSTTYQPATPAESRNSRPPYILRCIEGNFKALQAPELGKTALAQTKSLRCPDLRTFYQKIKEVSGCYEKKMEPQWKSQALRIFESVRDSQDVYECLPESDRENLIQQILRLKAKEESGSQVSK